MPDTQPNVEVDMWTPGEHRALDALGQSEQPTRDIDAAWTPGPWVSMAGTDDEYVEVEGMGGVRVEGAYRCDGYPVTVAAVVSTDEAGWEGIGCTYATARLVALAPEMAAAILAWRWENGSRSTHDLRALADKLRAIGGE